MSKQLVTKDETRNVGQPFSDVVVNLPKHDADITLVLPNGQKVALQWRIEAVSLDVCLPEPRLLVTCWEGEDMKPAPAYTSQGTTAKKYFAPGHVRQCGQLVIDFGPNFLEPVRESLAEPRQPTDDCETCFGYGYFMETGEPTIDRRCRKCLDCSGTGKR